MIIYKVGYGKRTGRAEAMTMAHVLLTIHLPGHITQICYSSIRSSRKYA